MASSIASQLDDAIDEDAWRRNAFGVERAERNDLADLDDAERGCHRHCRVEVARRFSVGEISPSVGAVRLEKRDIALQGRLEHVELAVNLARLLALGEPSADSDRRIEAAKTGGGAAHALADRPLRHQL